MSSTRRALDNAPLSQERYMSSPEYAELRGLSGNAVARKAAYLEHPRKKSLLFWLQAMSLRPGGLPKLAKEFIAANAQRIGTKTLLSKTLRDDRQCYPPQLAEQIAHEVDGGPGCAYGDAEQEAKEYREWQKQARSTTRAQWLHRCQGHAERKLVSVLMEIAINPKVEIHLPGEAESNLVKERESFGRVYGHEELRYSFKSAALDYFDGLIPALLEFQDAQAQRVREQFVTTQIARQVWETLDKVLRRAAEATEGTEARIALIEGAAGVGKSEAVKAWCEMHLGEVRMIKLVGVSNQTGFFRALAKVLGLASSYTRTATEMQSRVEGVLQSSKLMVIVDEAQYGFSSADRIYTQPVLMNWIYSALANYGVPSALIATEQFGRKLRQAEEQVIWAGGPAFKRRLRPHVKLPAKPSAGELLAIARKQMSGASDAAVKEIVGYAGATDYSLTNLVDAIQEAREIAAEAGHSHITYEDARRAVSEFREPSDAASKQCFGATEGRRGSRRRAIEAPMQAPMQEPFRGHEGGVKVTPDEQDLPDLESAENARFGTAKSGRMGRSLLTT